MAVARPTCCQIGIQSTPPGLVSVAWVTCFKLMYPPSEAAVSYLTKHSTAGAP